MGVPVLTLRGDHYVSRMAHAVLSAAGLHDWSVTEPMEFWRRAEFEAQPHRLEWLRTNRSHWRQVLQSSPLGDAADLMKHLERAFEDLVRMNDQNSASIASL